MPRKAQKPDIRERFGFAVKSRREHLGLNQEELAERAGIHRTYLSDVERGSRNLSLINIEKLAGALSLSLSLLFTEVEKI
jgi:transcriptional regulator with XRE-family HTH domain